MIDACLSHCLFLYSSLFLFVLLSWQMLMNSHAYTYPTSEVINTTAAASASCNVNCNVCERGRARMREGAIRVGYHPKWQTHFRH